MIGNFWRCFGGLALLAVVGLAIEFAVFLKANHDERMKIVEQRQKQVPFALKRECRLAFPNSIANQNRCFEEGQER